MGGAGLRALALSLVATVAACGAPFPGTEGEPCVGDGALCVEGLTCVLGTCQPRAPTVPIPGAPAGMIGIPALTFLFGCHAAVDAACAENEAEGAWRTVERAFAIDRFEVTVAEYATCTAAGACGAVTSTASECNLARRERADHPMNCVPWGHAEAYCAWRGKRLPSELEWELAARGPDGLVYPWGHAPPASCERAVLSEGGDGCGQGSTGAVGTRPGGASPFGVFDMAGNVYEWTSTGEPAAGTRVARGGSWLSASRSVRASHRVVAPLGQGYVDAGLRCVIDL